MHKLIGTLFVAWALLHNIGASPPDLPQCVPPPPFEEALLPDGTEPTLPNANFAPFDTDFIKEQEAAAAEVREITSPEPIQIVEDQYIESPEIIYVDPNIPWSYSVQVAPRRTYYQPIQTFPFYNCTTSS